MNLFKKTTESAHNKKRFNKEKIIALSGKSVKTDWLALLITLVVLLLAVIVWSIVQYFMLGNVFTENNTQVSTKEIIKAEKLDRVVEKYNTRTTQFRALVPGFQFYAVPSAERTQELLEQDAYVATSSSETITEAEVVDTGDEGEVEVIEDQAEVETTTATSSSDTSSTTSVNTTSGE